jgi:hypothetical protein
MTPAGHTTAVRIIHDLIQIHFDRSENYRRALFHFGHSAPDLKVIFGEAIRQSIQYQQELLNGISAFDGSPQHHKRRGNVYNTWARGKTEIGGEDHKIILESCKVEMVAVRLAYQAALAIAGLVEPTLRRLLESQLYGIRSMLDSLEQYENAL